MIKSLFILVLLTTISCASTKYNVDKTLNDFSKIQAGTKYTIFDKNDQKVSLNVTSVEHDSIRGTRKNLPFAMAKKDIKKIKKNKTGATVILISGTAGLLILSYVIVDAALDLAEGFGGAIGGQ